MSSFPGILGVIDLVAAVLIAIYLNQLGSWIWIVVLALVLQGFLNIIGMLK